MTSLPAHADCFASRVSGLRSARPSAALSLADLAAEEGDHASLASMVEGTRAMKILLPTKVKQRVTRPLPASFAGARASDGFLPRLQGGGWPLPDKRPLPELGEGLLQLGLRVHHDRAVPGDRLLDRLAGDEQEADALFAGLHRHFVAAIEQNERAIAGSFAPHELIDAVGLLGEHAERRRSGAEIARTLEHIGEGMALDFHLEGLAPARRHGNIEIARVSGHAFNRT